MFLTILSLTGTFSSEENWRAALVFPCWLANRPILARTSGEKTLYGPRLALGLLVLVFKADLTSALAASMQNAALLKKCCLLIFPVNALVIIQI